MSLIGALKAAKRTAPFYSAVDEALAAIKRPKGTGAEFYTELTKQAGVKKAELADRKLEQAFKAKGKMTKEEAQQVLADNPPPKLKEKVYDDSTAIDENDLREMVSQEMFGKPYSQISFGSAQHRKISDEVYKRMDMDNGTLFGKYKTGGGENYREILLKLPTTRPIASNYSDPAKYDADLRAYNASGKSDYYGSHYPEESNIIAHMRVQDRKGPNGEKILHIEEIQSDLHQAGRKKGYVSDELGTKVSDEEYKLGVELQNRQRRGEPLSQDELASLDDIMSRHSRSYSGGKVIDAPFKKNWHELAMKRLLNYAADNGYDSIAITPGAEQASRYDLSKQVGQISYTPSTKNLMAFDHQGNAVVNQTDVNPEDLEKYLGVSVTQKLTQAGFEGPSQILRGSDISVGGEGMKGFYDKMIPDYLNTFGKPYGAQVGQIQAPIKHELEGLRRMAGMAEEPPITLHNFPITPEMRESIKQKGLPLYQQVGIPTAGAGAASQALQPEEEAGLATGGVVKSAVKQAQLAKLAKMREEMAPRAEAVKALIARDQNRYLGDVVPNSLTNAEIEAEIKRMAAKAPMFMKPSALTELRKTVQQEKGDYGSRRLERAADEIPNLEKLYKEQALKEAFTGDNARALMTMNPKDFGKYAMPLDSREHYGYESQSEYIDKLAKLVGGFNDVPFLEINKREQGAPKIPFISGHEGRHRSRALESNAEPASLVRLLPRSELREPFPRRSQEEYIDALKKELEITGNKVIPEKYFDNFKQEELKRPPIILPDIYAKGGAVKPKVKDAKSGKVTMTKNRDTMFMELSNKKLKRK